MNANQRAQLQNRITKKEHMISQLETRLGNASGVFKTKVADQLTAAKQELTKMREELRQGEIADRENLATQKQKSLETEKETAIVENEASKPKIPDAAPNVGKDDGTFSFQGDKLMHVVNGEWVPFSGNGKLIHMIMELLYRNRCSWDTAVRYGV